MRDKRLAFPKPTAGTEGGGISCFHFWGEDFRSLTKNPHRQAALRGGRRTWQPSPSRLWNGFS